MKRKLGEIVKGGNVGHLRQGRWVEDPGSVDGWVVVLQGKWVETTGAPSEEDQVWSVEGGADATGKCTALEATSALRKANKEKKRGRDGGEGA